MAPRRDVERGADVDAKDAAGQTALLRSVHQRLSEFGGRKANATIVTASTNKTKLKLRKLIVHSLDRRYSSAIEAESYHAPDYAQDQGQPETHWASLSNSIVMPLRGT